MADTETEEQPMSQESANAPDSEKTDAASGNAGELSKEGDDVESMEVDPSSPESRVEEDQEEKPSEVNKDADKSEEGEPTVVEEEREQKVETDNKENKTDEEKRTTSSEKTDKEDENKEDESAAVEPKEEKEDVAADKKEEAEIKTESTEENQGESKDSAKDDSKETETKQPDPLAQRAEMETRTFDFPKTLEEFKYAFNEDGELLHTETGEKFNFHDIKDDHLHNQKRYEALGEIITEYVYDLLEKDVQLKKVHIPVDAAEEEPTSFIFQTEDALTNPNKLMLLIHGSGVVRAGQWARSLIINQNLDNGTQIPYIKQAKEEGYGVIVLNSNDNYNDKERKVPIRDNRTPEDHTRYVWDNFVMKSAAKHIFIVAHSYGGLCVVDLCLSREVDFYKKTEAVAMTDSSHSLHLQEVNHRMLQWFSKHAVNWVTSEDPVNTELKKTILEVAKRSAGTKKHEETSCTSKESVFKYFSAKLAELEGQKETKKVNTSDKEKEETKIQK